MTVLRGLGLSKRFGSRQVVEHLDVEVCSGECLGIIGPNGSGKSTVLKMLGGLLRPDSGSVTLSHNNQVISNPLSHTGLVAPWLSVYEEFTTHELLELQYRLHGQVPQQQEVDETLARLQLAGRASDLVRQLSSGLRQRVLLSLAVIRTPHLLLLDEPSVTLDSTGKKLVQSEIERHRRSGGVVILATNDVEEAAWCTATSSLTT